jgi:hypothetical protein
LQLADTATSQTINIKTTYTPAGGAPITSANFSITITIAAIPSVYKSADASD